MENQTESFPFRTEAEFFNTFVPEEHPFRQLTAIIDFTDLVEPLHTLYSDLGTTGIAVEKGFKCLLVQFWEDYSDRQMEKAVKENLAVRWFCGFMLTEETPDHSYFGKLRKRLGTKRIADLFNRVNDILKSHNLIGNVFHFIDASAIITKTHLWTERDRAIKDGADTLNNKNVEKYAADSQARWGQKSATNIWFGYKRHVSVDMRFGLITKLRVTPGNVLDFEVIKSLLPSVGMAFMDKLYDIEAVIELLKKEGIANATILKNNRKAKNRDLDRWRSSIRMPFESTFSKQEKRARYRGNAKVTMQAFLEAIAHNLKKAVRILQPATAIPR